MYEELKKQIKAINEFSDIKQVAKIKERLRYLNTHDPNAVKVLELARERNLV